MKGRKKVNEKWESYRCLNPYFDGVLFLSDIDCVNGVKATRRRGSHCCRYFRLQTGWQNKDSRLGCQTVSETIPG
jgi:hypothetical protein